MKVELRKNLRHFESEDTDFYISANEQRELSEKYLKSYSIKYHLLHGNLKIIEGEAVLNIKHAKVFFSAEEHPWCFGIEFGKLFKKNLDTQQIFWIDKDDLTNYKPSIYEKLKPEEELEEEPEEELEVEPEEELKEEPEEEPEEELEDNDNSSKEDEKFSKTDFINMSKKEQVDKLKEYGLTMKEINALRVEDNRVEKLLELQG